MDNIDDIMAGPNLIENKRKEEQIAKEQKETMSFVNNHRQRQKDSIKKSANVYHSSIKSYGAEKISATKKTKLTNKKVITRTALVAMLSAGLVLMAGKLGLFDAIDRQIQLNDANSYMDKAIISYLDENKVDYVINDKNKIDLTDNVEQLKNLSEALQSDGFSRDEALYVVSQTCGYDDFSKSCKAYGFANAQDFLYDNYRTDTNGDYNRFENNNQEGVVETVNHLRESEKLGR